MLDHATLPNFLVATTPDVRLRPATLDDARAIADLVELGVREGQLLPRTLEAIRANITDWVVAEDRGHIVGTGSLVEMNHALAEVRSLVVAPAYRHLGVGKRIVNALIDLARARGIPTVFTLTRAVLFFEQLGFVITEKENFPEKVWRDCALCPVQFACDEVAMVLSVK
jgi:amino-acid N-acetyltransferase